MSARLLGCLAITAASVLMALALPASAAAKSPTSLTSVSCSSTSHCWAGASDGSSVAILATTDGGEAWHVEYMTRSFDDIAGMDCTSSEHCVAIGDTGEGTGAAFLETTDGGQVWSRHAAPKSMAIAESLSCSGASDCWAIGYAGNRVDAAVARTTDGGARWTSQAVPKLVTAMSSPFGISCPSSADCVATGEGAITTTDGGRTWTDHTVPGGAALGPVTCPSSADCYAVFDVTSAIPANEEAFVYRSTDGGAAWAEVLSGPKRVAGLGGISCPSKSSCVAVGGGYAPEAGGDDALYGLSETTTTAGRDWSETKVSAAQYLFADSCVARTADCVAVGSARGGTSGLVVRTTDAGARWTAVPLPKL